MTLLDIKKRLQLRRDAIAETCNLDNPTIFNHESLDGSGHITAEECRSALSDISQRESISLNIGCGGDARKDAVWINVDARPIGGVDLCVDLFSLCDWVPDSCVDKVYNKDVIEHFAWKDEVEKQIRIWWRVLKPGGELEVITPDLRTVISRYVDKKDDGCNWLWAMYHLYGMQTYPYNYHKCLFDFVSLSTKLRAEGFTSIVHNPNIGNHLHVTAKK